MRQLLKVMMIMQEPQLLAVTDEILWLKMDPLDELGRDF